MFYFEKNTTTSKGPYRFQNFELLILFSSYIYVYYYIISIIITKSKIFFLRIAFYKTHFSHPLYNFWVFVCIFWLTFNLIALLYVIPELNPIINWNLSSIPKILLIDTGGLSRLFISPSRPNLICGCHSSLFINICIWGVFQFLDGQILRGFSFEVNLEMWEGVEKIREMDYTWLVS